MAARRMHRSVARFVVVGGSNFAVSFVIFAGVMQLLPTSFASVRGAIANVAAYAAGMLNSFVLNRAWTFRAEGSVAVHAMRFAVLNAATLGGSTLVVFVLVDRLGYPGLVVWLPLTVAILLAHYLGMRYWAFAPNA